LEKDQFVSENKNLNLIFDVTSWSCSFNKLKIQVNIRSNKDKNKNNNKFNN
jgi:hypothetical protein